MCLSPSPATVAVAAQLCALELERTTLVKSDRDAARFTRAVAKPCGGSPAAHAALREIAGSNRLFITGGPKGHCEPRSLYGFRHCFGNARSVPFTFDTDCTSLLRCLCRLPGSGADGSCVAWLLATTLLQPFILRSSHPDRGCFPEVTHSIAA